MKLKLVGRRASMILGLIVTMVPGFSRTPVSDVQLTVRMYNYGNLSAGARKSVAATAKRILGQAGVAVRFVECFNNGAETGAPACTAPLGPTVFLLKIVKKSIKPEFAVSDKLLGYAAMTPEGGSDIAVFIDPQQRKATVSSLSDDTLLGHAVAHEIGHLLLGPSHSSNGIMRPVWRPCDEEWMAKGFLVFDGHQARRMRSALMARSSR